MSAGVRDLTRILDEETALAKQLVEMLQQDQRRVIEQDVDALEESNLRKEELILRLGALEQSRRDVARALAGSLGVPPDEARVAALCERLGPAGAPLEASAQKLRAVLASLGELVAVGRGFLEQSILGIRSMLNLIQTLRAPDPGAYDASGRPAQPTEGQPMTLRQEV